MAIYDAVSYQHFSSKQHCLIAFQDNKQMFSICNSLLPWLYPLPVNALTFVPYYPWLNATLRIVSSTAPGTEPYTHIQFSAPPSTPDWSSL